uniref:RRM domain-containing protein n=1 Tax=Bursaphelenchus xylophilus TaxID=6326 RepID=A0A1I7SFG8_BURXY
MSKRKCFSKNNCLTNGNIHGTNYDIIQPDFQGYRFTPKVEPMEAENDVIHPELVDEYREVIKAVVKEEGEESPNEEEATMKRKKREAKKKPASRRKTMTSRRSAGSSGRVRLSTKQKLDSSMGREAGAAEEDGESDEEATELSMQAQDPLSKAGRSLALKRKKSVKRCITINRMQIHQLCDSPNQETVDSILTKMPRMNVSGDSIATIDVMPCKDDKFFVVNGVNVWLAAKQADRKELEVLVWPSLTLAEIVLLRYQESDELKLGHWAPSHTQIVKDLRALMDASVIVFRANDFSSDHTISRRTASLKVAALPAFVKEFHVQIACKPAEQRDALVRLLELMEKTVWQRKSRKGPNRRGQVSILRQFFRNFVWSKHGKNLVKLIAQAEADGTVFDIGDTALFSVKLVVAEEPSKLTLDKLKSGQRHTKHEFKTYQVNEDGNQKSLQNPVPLHKDSEEGGM